MIDSIFRVPDNAGKDAHPLDTVAKIKGILSEHGIATEERWEESSVPHCHALRINIAGTTIGANGKGTTKEFTLASGYGELIERLQLGLIWKNKLQVMGGASSCEAQSQTVPADSLMQRNASWYHGYANKLQQTTGISTTGEEILRRYTDRDGNVQATPYYCLTSHTTEYLPTALCKAVYATSGGAAGNTMEEAMVQAFSEIVERHHKLRVIHEEIAVPEIPEEVLMSCPVAYEIITFLRSKGFRVIVKDCSLGMDFPVVCVCIIDTNTGKYHTHFGAFPDFNIALQRTLTESFQGRNLQNVTRHEDFFCTKELFDLRYLMIELVKGTSEKPPQFFFRTATEPYHPTKSFGNTNRERLKGCIQFFRNQNYDILVRDSSSLGFPTCQIVIPGYSEVLPQRMSEKLDDSRCSAFSSRALRNPVSAKPDDLFGLLMHIGQSNKLKLAGIENFTTEAGIPARLSTREENFLMSTALAHVNYTLGKTKEVLSYINKAIPNSPESDLAYLICVKRYLSMKQNNYTDEDISSTLNIFHQPETIQKLYSHLNAGTNPLTSVVLQCDLQCSADCPLYDRCKKKHSDDIANLIIRKAKELDQSPLQQMLAEL